METITIGQRVKVLKKTRGCPAGYVGYVALVLEGYALVVPNDSWSEEEKDAAPWIEFSNLGPVIGLGYRD